MRIHVKNIVADAISRGLIEGYEEVRPRLSKKKISEKEELEILGRLGLSIWKMLDDVIDFSDEDDDDEKSKLNKSPMGFAPSPMEPEITDVVSTTTLPSEDDGFDDDEDEDDDDATEDSRLRSARRR
jgi:hypothetical protein